MKNSILKTVLMLSMLAPIGFAAFAAEEPATATATTETAATATPMPTPPPPRSAFPRPSRRGTVSQNDAAVMAAMSPRNAERIGLSEEQRTKLKAIGSELREKSKSYQKTLREAVERQSTLMTAEKPDEAAVMAVIDEIFNARRELAKLQTRRIFQVKAILTTEQLAKAAEIVRERRERSTRRLTTGR